ncbi:hypothetical protein QUW57_09405 [Phocaeicola plebeius]|uniref:hypothetical protein n=1 Tax=Phocaeicola plebeius TaxID=310297 RepID=UPI0021ABEAD3|nr:hypothetical protein [Phocaeicola plebeius]MCR8883163.1 hypothetical protein [Phocaeicola plebeius]MDM8286793.1 hypothetical protein [Phocaeicola plebeius]
MKSFFQTSRLRSFLSACRITGKKWSASVPLLLAALLAVVFYSCRDEDLFPSMQSFEQGGTRADAASTSGLEVVQNATYGATYKPNCRVPLVGEGRVINQITKNLVGVLSNSDNKLEYLVDKKLDNSVSLRGLAEVNTGLPILSVKDVNRVYCDSSNGIKVGFLYKDPGGVLSLNVLQGFWIQTLLNGKEQETSKTQGSGNSFQLVNLNLLNVSGGLSEISFTTKLPFDEVRIGCGSISVDVLSGLEFYYAFVGENPKKIAAKEHEYPDAKQERPSTNITDLLGRNLVDSDISNGPTCELLSGLGGGLTCSVDFGATIPVGSEVGYYTTGGGLASISLGATKLNAYDTSDNNPQSINTESGIGVSALAGGAREFSMILAKENARRLELDLPAGINLLSAVRVHYAYSRDPVEIDVSSYFTIGNDTISTDYYNLPTPSEGGVSYSLVSGPDGATSSISGNRITGMTVNGDYVVKAVYTREGETSWSYAVIHRNKKEVVSGCNMMMINTSGNPTQYSVGEPLGAQGGISLFNKIKDTQNLVDAEYDNYAEATNVLSLIQLGGLASVKSTEEINTQKGKTRVGFVMQTNNQLLGADVLKFFFIRLYKGQTKVYEGLTGQNNTVGVGLIGNDGSKLRFYVETEEAFDRVELWSAGLLNINLNTFRLYYAFYEQVEGCENNTTTSEACMEMITAQKHGATINYAETKYPSVVGVGSTMNNLSYVIDNSQQTAASIVAGVSLISRSTVAVKFNRVRGGQPVGAILRTPGYVLSASVLQNVTIAAYNGGQAVASESTSGGLASIEVISDAGLAYMEVTPLQDYDEVRISFPSLANALKAVWLSGFYIRPDANGNGIPDCAEEPEDQGETDIEYKSITEHVCVGETTYLGNVRISVDAKDDLLNTELTFTCYPYNGNGQKIEQKAKLDRDNNGYFFELSLPVGDYSISGLPTYNGLRAQVHPRKTTWKRNASDTDWNNWSNWTDGSPWGCTNVVIPTGATRYPDLNAWGSVDKFYGGNYCANIHFEPGAAVLNTQYLEYECAYVEMEVQSGMYYMISTPLHGMVTGDMFVSPEMPAYFTPLNGDTYREVRHNPLVRQKMYSRAVKTATSGTNGTVVATADWSRTFNAVAQPYEQAQGIKMMVGNEEGTSYRLRFPKAYTEYNYYTLSGGWVKEETLPKEARNMNGKFAYEVSGFNPGNAGSSFTFELRNEEQGATYFVAGNPFMSYLDIKTFLTENKQSVQAIRIIDSESVFGEEEGLVRISLGENGDLSFDLAGEQSNTIAPLQAFYVEVLEGYTSDNVNITYTSDMFVQPSASTATRSSRSASVPTAGEMKISAVSGNSVSSCSLLRSAGASDAYNAKEDIVSLIDEDFMPKVKVYTVADKRALDIQKIKNAARVDLGFMVKDGSQQTRFTLDYGSNWKGWTLVDKQTGKRYLLDGTSLTVNAGAMKSNDGRFYLVKE